MSPLELAIQMLSGPSSKSSTGSVDEVASAVVSKSIPRMISSELRRVAGWIIDFSDSVISDQTGIPMWLPMLQLDLLKMCHFRLLFVGCNMVYRVYRVYGIPVCLSEKKEEGRLVHFHS
jgi:hypothetical protein